jgi:hypothetical protein
MKGSVKLPVFIDDARKYVNSAQLRAKYLGANYEAEYCHWQALHGLGSLMETASLIITPNAYKESLLMATYPPDGLGDLSVTRATTATRVNSAGLVELVPYNLLQRSEEFDNAYWGKNNGVIASNNTSAPDGNTTADKFTASAGIAFHYVNLFTAITINETHTFSFYVKKSTSTWIFFTFRDNAINYFNLDTGAFGTTPDSCTSQSVGNGWYRITITKNTTPANCGIGIAGGNGAAQFNAAGTEAVFIWGAQLVQGTQAKDYYPTTTRLNIPRLDYSLGSCPSLLVEPQRTNLALSSEDLTNATYWNNSNTTDTANQVISPDGTQDADRVNADAVNTFHRIYGQASISASTSYTYSVYAKANTLGFIQLALNNGFVVNYLLSPYANFNLTTGTVSQSGNGATAKIQSLGNGWYRCSITATSLVGALAGEYNINLINSGTLTPFQSWAGTTNDSVFIWGVQLEAGAYPTSYIQTTTASVTRNLDSISKTGISSLLNPSQGTFFVEASPFQSSEEKAIQLSNGSDLNVVMLNYYGSNEIRCSVIGSGSTYYRSVNTNVYNIKKMAVSWKSTGVYLYLNGVEYSVPLTAGSGGGVPSALDRLTFSYWWSGFPFLTNTKAVGVWKTQLTSAECIALTTL